MIKKAFISFLCIFLFSSIAFAWVCPNCGYNNPEGNRFCNKCGAKKSGIQTKTPKETRPSIKSICSERAKTPIGIRTKFDDLVKSHAAILTV